MDGDESPLPSLSKLVMTSVGRQHAKPLRQAFYNTAALAFLAIISFVTLGAYYVLEAFLRPLIWAALCGNFLFPFKKSLTRVLGVWLRQLEANGTPLIFGSVMVPFQLVNNAIGKLEHISKRNWKLLLSVFFLVPSCYLLVVFHPFEKMLYAGELVVQAVVYVLGMFDKPIAVWSLVLFYIVSLIFWQREVEESDILVLLNQYLSALVWFVVVFYVISLTGWWRLPIIVILVGFIGLGYANNNDSNDFADDSESESERPSPEMYRKRGRQKSVVQSLVDNTLTVVGIKETKARSKLRRTPTVSSSGDVSPLPEGEVFDSTSILKEKCRSDSSMVDPARPRSKMEQSESSTKQPTNQPTIVSSFLEKLKRKAKRRNRSAPYFIALFWMFALAFFWRNLWCLPVLFILLSLKYGFTQFFENQLNHTLVSYFNHFFEQRKDFVFPPVCRKILSLLRSGDRRLISIINGELDKLASIIIMLSLVVAAVIIAALFAVQVQKESSYLITVATNVMNRTYASNKEYMRWLNLNDSNILATVDDTFHTGYVVARSKAAEYVSSLIASKNTTQVEQQVVQLMDQLYLAWSGEGKGGESVEDSPHNSSFHHKLFTGVSTNSSEGGKSGIWTRMVKVYTGSDLTKLMEIINANLHTLYSILDSVWLLVKGNVSLMISIVTTIFSLLLTSGSFILNSLLSCVIFLTTLFYLLNSSTNEYRIKEWLTEASMGTRFGDSISGAVLDVFGASLKMATFYFFFTWLTHDTFGANLVFIPAALAALLGVVPFIGTYWAAVPAVLELWLVQEDGVLALSLLLLHFMPMYVVDTAIYSEIGEGGHSYLTGLAVVGGVYCFGLEGAFVGPFVLCCLIAAFDIYDSIINSSDYHRFSIF